MSEFCVINKAEELNMQLHGIILQLPLGEVRTAFSVWRAQFEELIMRAEREAGAQQQKIEELEEKIDQLLDPMELLHSDPDPYDLHGLHNDGTDTGHSWYTRFWQKLRSSFSDPDSTGERP